MSTDHEGEASASPSTIGDRIGRLDTRVAALWSEIAELEQKKAFLSREVAEGRLPSYWNRPPPPKRTHCILMMARNCADWIHGTIRNWYMAARDHDAVIIAIRVDDDDHATIDAIMRAKEKFRVVMVVGPRPKSPGAELTAMAKMVDADFYHVVNDDNYPQCWAFDRHISAYQETFGEFGMAGWCPTPPRHKDGRPGYAGDYPVFTRAWLHAAGEVFTDRFPFWFMDLGACHVYELVFGHKPYPLYDADYHLPLHLAARKSSFTSRFRDYAFWTDYYFALMPERVAKAREIAAILGVEHHITPDKIAELNHRAWQTLIEDPGMATAVAVLGDPAPPDPAYLEAKAEAERHLAQLTGANAA